MSILIFLTLVVGIFVLGIVLLGVLGLVEILSL